MSINLIFTKHASERLKLRNVNIKEVELSILKPDKIYKDIKTNNNVYVKKSNQYTIIIIAKKKISPIRLLRFIKLEKLIS